MLLHNKKLQYTVHVDTPNVPFAKLCLEQFGGPNGELGAAVRYFTQGWAESDPPVATCCSILQPKSSRTWRWSDN
jgi:Mn-containing catalase